MNASLSRLGVPSLIQNFFQVGKDLTFHYGDVTENYGDGFHRLPVTENIWFAGMHTAPYLIVTYSAMEAIAFITLNRHRYPRLEQIAFAAIGSKLHAGQIAWMRQHFANRRITFTFGDELLGHLTAIKLAAGIRNVPIQIFHAGHQVGITNSGQQWLVSDEKVSLHGFQEAFCIRPRFREARPRLAFTFLDQLRNSAG